MLAVILGAPAVSALDEQQLMAQVNIIPELVAQGKLKPGEIPNPHWRDGACHACHAGNPGTSSVALREKNTDQVCNYCHDALFDHSYIHPVNVKPDAEMMARMPESFRNAVNKSSGAISCATCHDLQLQCLKQYRNQRLQNLNFFRDGPFRTRFEQCYFCHDEKKYERLNPHEQISDDGRLRSATCQICHVEKLEVLQKLQGIENLHFYRKKRLELMCIGCHPVGPHPGGQTYTFRPDKEPSNHLVVPKAAMQQWMQQQAQQRGIELPLEPATGKIFCATCHNPHDDGVVENALPQQAELVPSGKNKEKRLRTNEICLQCHDK